MTPRRLFTASEIAELLGVNRRWVHNALDRGFDAPPAAEFTAHTGGRSPLLLWTEAGLRRWEAYYAGVVSIPTSVSRHSAYSDHRAVNKIGQHTVTWKLWWKCCPNGGTDWWFSTPHGWWVSDNDGRDWRSAETMVRPTDYHYFSVNGNTNPSRALAAVVRSATRLRQRLEEEE